MRMAWADEVYCYRYVYDAGGNLVYKEGHSDSMNIKVNYTYKDGKTVENVHLMSR